MPDEIDQDDRVALDDAAQGDHADHRGGGEEHGVLVSADHPARQDVQQPEARHDPDHRERDREHDHDGQQVRRGFVDQQNVDRQQRGGERDAQVAEDVHGDLPFAFAFPVRTDARGQGILFQGRLEIQHGVRGPAPGHFRGDVHDALQVFVEDGLVDDVFLEAAEFAELHALAHAALDQQGLQAVGVGPLVARHAQHDRQFVLLGRNMDRARRHAAERDAQRVDDVLGGDAAQAGLLAIDPEEQLLLVRLDHRVDVDDAFLPGHALPDCVGRRDELVVIVVRLPVDLGDDGRKDGRAGRHFDDLQVGVVAPADFLDGRPDAQRDLVAVHRAPLTGQQVDADVAGVRALAQVVMPDQPVEIDRRADADRRGEIDHFRLGAEVFLDLLRDAVGGFQRRRFRHVDDDLELVLVVERQHLQRNQAGRGQHDGEDEQTAHDQQHGDALFARIDQRAHDAVVDSVDAGRPDVVRLLPGAALAQQLAGDPGRDGEGHQHRADHRQRDVQRHRRHVRAHHAADEKHRDERHDDRQRGQYDRRHDLVHGEQHGLLAGVLAHRKVARDVFHTDDRVVDEQPERQDQREQCHSVDRVAHEIIEEQCQGIGDRNRESDDRALAPGHGQRNHADDGDDAHPEVAHEVVDLGVRGFAVVARDAHLDVVGNGLAAQFGQHLLDLARHPDRVAAFFLRDGNGHRRIRPSTGHFLLARPESDPGVRGRLFGTVDHFRDVAQVDGAILMDADHQVLRLAHILQERAGLDGDHVVALLERAGFRLRVGDFQRSGHFHRRKPVGREPLGVQVDVQDPFLSAVNGDVRAVGDLLQRTDDLFGDSVERVRVVLRAVQGRVDDRHVVDFDRFDDPAGDTRRGLVDVLEYLVVELDQAFLAVLADEEADGDDRHARARHGVDVFHAVDLVQHPLEARGDHLFHFLRAAAGIHHQDVGQRHDDLRLLLARGQDQRRRAGDQADDDQQDRQVAAKERPDQARQKGMFLLFHD